MRVGVHDLRAMSGDRFDVFVAQSYYGKWPVNRVDLKLGILPRIEICASLVTARIDLSRHVFADLTQALQSVRDQPPESGDVVFLGAYRHNSIDPLLVRGEHSETRDYLV
jgi:hypothetical protein